MFAKMSGQRLAVESSSGQDADTIRRQGVRGNPDVSALASLDQNKLCVLLWHYHDDDLPGPDASIELSLGALPKALGSAKLAQYRIDADHSNSYETWKRMGSPQQPTPEQYAQLEKAGQLMEMAAPERITSANGDGVLKLSLPRQAVSLIVVSWD
jgi:xylan 1,4-beta-xylosidase